MKIVRNLTVGNILRNRHICCNLLTAVGRKILLSIGRIDDYSHHLCAELVLFAHLFHIAVSRQTSADRAAENSSLFSYFIRCLLRLARPISDFKADFAVFVDRLRPNLISGFAIQDKIGCQRHLTAAGGVGAANCSGPDPCHRLPLWFIGIEFTEPFPGRLDHPFAVIRHILSQACCSGIVFHQRHGVDRLTV